MNRRARWAAMLLAVALSLAPWVQALAEWGGGGGR